MILYRVLRWTMRLYFRARLKIRFEGEENVPEEGPKKPEAKLCLLQQQEKLPVAGVAQDGRRAKVADPQVLVHRPNYGRAQDFGVDDRVFYDAAPSHVFLGSFELGFDERHDEAACFQVLD